MPPEGQKPDRCANLPARPPRQTHRCRRLSSVSHRLSGVFPDPLPRRPVWLSVPSGVSQQRLSAAGEGAFTVTPQNPQPQNSEKRQNPQRKITHQTKSKTYTKTKSAPLTRFPPTPHPAIRPKHPKSAARTTYPQTRTPYPQNQPRNRTTANRLTPYPCPKYPGESGQRRKRAQTQKKGRPKGRPSKLQRSSMSKPATRSRPMPASCMCWRRR